MTGPVGSDPGRGMSKRDERERYEDADGDEVEILEVVGFDDHEPAEEEAEDASDADEIVLSLDEEDETEAEQSPADDDRERRFLRLQADYDNLRKRIDRERADIEALANSELIGRLLPVLDNFERALEVNGNGNGGEAFREGVLMIYKQFRDELRREGLQTIDSVGEPFDPRLHDAVATVETGEHPVNTVVDEMLRGYVYQRRVLRPAMVKVSAPPRTDGSGTEDPA